MVDVYEKTKEIQRNPGEWKYFWPWTFPGKYFRGPGNLKKIIGGVYEKANTWPNFRPTFWAKNLGQHSSQKFWSKKSFSKMKAKEWANKN